MYCKKCNSETEGNSNMCPDCQLKQAEANPDKEDANEVYAFLFKGRIGRLRYITYRVFLLLILALPLGIIKDIYGPSVMQMLFLFLTLPIMAKRLRDISLPGYLTIPIFLIAFFSISLPAAILIDLILIFKKGTEGENKYGLPKENSKSITWATTIILAIIAAGTLSIIFL